MDENSRLFSVDHTANVLKKFWNLKPESQRMFLECMKKLDDLEYNRSRGELMDGMRLVDQCAGIIANAHYGENPLEDTPVPDTKTDEDTDALTAKSPKNDDASYFIENEQSPNQKGDDNLPPNPDESPETEKDDVAKETDDDKLPSYAEINQMVVKEAGDDVDQTQKGPALQAEDTISGDTFSPMSSDAKQQIERTNTTMKRSMTPVDLV